MVLKDGVVLFSYVDSEKWSQKGHNCLCFFVALDESIDCEWYRDCNETVQNIELTIIHVYKFLCQFTSLVYNLNLQSKTKQCKPRTKPNIYAQHNIGLFATAI